MKNVLIVDSDLGFVFWLGQALDAAGFETLPAKGVFEAISLLAEYRVIIHVLLIRYALPGAVAFASDLRWAQGGHLRTIGLIDEGDERAESLPAWDSWQIKPRVPNDEAREAFRKLVQRVLAPSTVMPGT